MPAVPADCFPYSIREVENLWIRLADGCRLAARAWLPKSSRPAPAVIEYIPYGKRDGTRRRDEAMHRYFAGHGFAALRIDLRGTGDSDGVLDDEYSEQELADGVAAIEWVAAQSWCDGRIGMIGKSWGGFNALQIASRAPANLRAVISVCAADDRYSDDAHYMGGCLLNENQIWGAMLFTLHAAPPDPAIVGARWRELWLARLESAEPYAARWLSHARRDDYWRHGSVCEDYAAIRCAVLAVGGWADGYTNAVPRLVRHLAAPVRGLVGPWGHQYPHDGVPGPAIAFPDEALRWWDQWLKGIEPEHSEPRYRTWMPVPGSGGSGGRWVAEAGWPSERVRPQTFFLGAAGLTPEPQAPSHYRVDSPPTTGLCAGAWCAFGHPGELPLDQRDDDDKSICFDSAPLDEPLQLLGAPLAEFELQSSQPVALIAVRLNAVAPDGHSRRISYGVLNLTHRSGHERVDPLPVNEPVNVRLQLNDTAWTLAAGHRLRLAVSTNYWPQIWPSPRRAALTLNTARCRLALPLRRPTADDDGLRPFGEPRFAVFEETEPVVAVPSERKIVRDAATSTTRYVIRTRMSDDGHIALNRIASIDLTVGHGIVETFTIADDDPLSARAEIEQCSVAARGVWSTEVRTRFALLGDANSFHVEASLEALEGGEPVFARTWREAIRRDGI